MCVFTTYLLKATSLIVIHAYMCRNSCSFFCSIFLSNMPNKFLEYSNFISVQFTSVTQSCPILCNPTDCSTPDLPIQHQLLESTQTCVH